MFSSRVHEIDAGDSLGRWGFSDTDLFVYPVQFFVLLFVCLVFVFVCFLFLLPLVFFFFFYFCGVVIVAVVVAVVDGLTFTIRSTGSAGEAICPVLSLSYPQRRTGRVI